jgi:ABC-type nitrate/sulfonate/bicarbonate transport system permease component
MSEPGTRRKRFSLRGSLVSVGSLASFLALWELAFRLEWVNPLFVSAPSMVASSASSILTSDTLHHDLWVTLVGFSLSFVVATVGGVLLGVLIGYSDVAYHLLNPFIVSLNALPKIVLMPLVILWFGMGLPSKLFLAGLMAGFPIIVSTLTGVRSIERDFVLLARSYQASRFKIFRSILLPSIIPFVLSGMRVGINYGMVGVLLVEFFASNEGVGYRMVLYTANFQIDLFFVLLFVVIAFTLACTAVIERLESRFGRWRPAAF